MKLGYAIDAFQPDSASPIEAGNAVVRRAQRAKDSGFDYVQCPDHHVSTDRKFFQNLPTAARLSGVFDHVAVMCLLPLYDPVTLAEQLGTLGCFVEELDVWCAVGGHEPSFAALGVPVEERARRFEENLSVIEALMAGDAVRFDGEFVSLDDVGINPPPDPRLCIGGSAKPAVQRAGKRGDAWVVSSSETDEDVERKLAWFEGAGGGELVVRRHALVRETGAEAVEAVEDLLRQGYRGWDDVGGRILYGDVADVTERLEKYRELGVDEIVVSPVSDDHEAETLTLLDRAREELC